MAKDDDRKKEVDALYKRFGMKNEEGRDFDPYDPILDGLEKLLFLQALQRVRTIKTPRQIR